jgi:hypothetical protein
MKRRFVSEWLEALRSIWMKPPWARSPRSLMLTLQINHAVASHKAWSVAELLRAVTEIETPDYLNSNDVTCELAFSLPL